MLYGWINSAVINLYARQLFCHPEVLHCDISNHLEAEDNYTPTPELHLQEHKVTLCPPPSQHDVARSRNTLLFPQCRDGGKFSVIRHKSCHDCVALDRPTFLDEKEKKKLMLWEYLWMHKVIISTVISPTVSSPQYQLHLQSGRERHGARARSNMLTASIRVDGWLQSYVQCLPLSR